MGWVGRMHSRAMEAWKVAINSDTTKNKCKVLEKFLRKATWLGEDAGRVNRDDLNNNIPAVLDRNPLCQHSASPSNTASSKALHPFVGAATHATVFSNVAFARKRADISSYLDDIESAMGSTSNSTDLTAAISVIVDDASSNLSGDDLDNVNAAASFTVSTAEYWEENTDSQVSALAAGPVGTCFANGGSEDDCVRAVAWTPDHSSRLQARQAAYKAARCPYSVNGWDIASGDVAGLIGGFFATLNPGAAIAGGVGASAGVFLVEGIHAISCMF